MWQIVVDLRTTFLGVLIPGLPSQRKSFKINDLQVGISARGGFEPHFRSIFRCFPDVSLGNFHHGGNPRKVAEAKVWSFLVNQRTFFGGVRDAVTSDDHGWARTEINSLEPWLFAVVEDDSHGVPMAGTHTADAVTQIHSVCALGALYGAMTDREGHSITLLKAYHLGPGLHAGALFG